MLTAESLADALCEPHPLRAVAGPDIKQKVVDVINKLRASGLPWGKILMVLAQVVDMLTGGKTVEQVVAAILQLLGIPTSQPSA